MRKSIRFRWKHWLLLCVGLLVMAFGVAFSIKGLGTSPISSLPYVISRITPLTVGTATIAMHVTLILLQILLLRRRYQLMQLLQLPVALLFGMLTDAAVNALQGIVPGSYPAQWGLCLVGIALVGIGVSMEVTANVVVLAGEGMVLAVCQVFPVKFAAGKVGFDVTLVLLAMPISGSIGHGIGLAMISYTVIKVFSGKAKDVSALTYVITLLFLVKFFAVV